MSMRSAPPPSPLVCSPPVVTGRLLPPASLVLRVVTGLALLPMSGATLLLLLVSGVLRMPRRASGRTLALKAANSSPPLLSRRRSSGKWHLPLHRLL